MESSVQSVWASPDLEFTRVRTAGHSKAKTARRLHRVFTRQAVPGRVCDLLTDKSPDPRRPPHRVPERTVFYLILSTV